MMGYFALTYTLHIHQSLNEIEKLQKSLQKGGWSLAAACPGLVWALLLGITGQSQG